jgi:hypothetical protein
MKDKILRGVLLWCLLIGAMSCTSDGDGNGSQQYSELMTALQSTGAFCEFKENPDTAMVNRKDKMPYKEQWSMFFNQALDHNNEEGEKFKQQVCILFRGFYRPTIYVTEGYMWRGFRDNRDLAHNINANIVVVERRNYGSSQNQDWGKWNYQTAKQGSADLHAVYEALKPILKGKWMSSGTSKNGETSLFYAYHYPQDMTLAAAYCLPLILGLHDKRFGKYLMEEVGTEDARNMMKALIRRGLENAESGIYQDVCKKMEADGKRVPIYTEYVFNLFETFFQLFQYDPSPAERIRRMQEMMDSNDVFVEKVIELIDDNRDETFAAYWPECAKEFGMIDSGYDYFADLLDGTSFDRNMVLPCLLKPEERHLVNTYDGTLVNEINSNFVMNPSCPLLLYYVRDDPWTIGKPAMVGPMTKLIVNPIGKHNSDLNDPALCPPEIKQKVVDFVQKYLN